MRYSVTIIMLLPVMPPQVTLPPATQGPVSPRPVALWLGIASVIAVVVPPGLFVAPWLGLVAVVLGVRGLASGRASRTEDVIAVALGLVAVIASAAVIWYFWPEIREAINSARHR